MTIRAMRTFSEAVENEIKNLFDPNKTIVEGRVPETDLIHSMIEVEERRVRVRDHDGVIEWEAEPECSMCGDTGEVSQMEQVYPGEPHMADIGTAPCPDCKIEN